VVEGQVKQEEVTIFDGARETVEVDGEEKKVEEVIKEHKGTWHHICDGFIKGDYSGRKGFGSTEDDHIGLEACQVACLAKEGCNVATYSAGDGKCWLELIPPQQKKYVEPMPRPSDCKANAGTKSYWFGDPADTALGEVDDMPEDWYLFCQGYAQHDPPATGFGKSAQSHLGKVGCMKDCVAIGGCNFVTYDTTTGDCWREHVNQPPEDCDGNDVGWSYMLDDVELVEAMDSDAGMDEDGWHFVCTGFVKGDSGGRMGLGSATEKQLGQQGCKQACDDKPDCNFVTYDSWSGTCWMETMPMMPLACNDNSAGWSYWRGEIEFGSLIQETQDEIGDP